MADDDRGGGDAGEGREPLPGRARTARLLALTAGCIVASAAVLIAVLLGA